MKRFGNVINTFVNNSWEKIDLMVKGLRFEHNWFHCQEMAATLDAYR